jgi:hypothetical protein
MDNGSIHLNFFAVKVLNILWLNPEVFLFEHFAQPLEKQFSVDSESSHVKQILIDLGQHVWLYFDISLCGLLDVKEQPQSCLEVRLMREFIISKL